MNIRFLFFIGLECLAWSLPAQDGDDWHATEERLASPWMASMYVDWGIASQEFAYNLENDHGFGLGGELLYNVQRNRPVWAGVGVHKFNFDRDKLRYSDTIDGIIYNYRDLTVSRVFMLHGMVRFQPEVDFPLQPYVQGAAGVHWFYTNTKIKDTDYDEEVDRINESRDAIWGFALHAGFQYVPEEVPELRIDTRFGYFRNASVEYLRYNPAIPGNYPIDSFESKISPVDLFGIHIGLTLVIRPIKDM